MKILSTILLGFGFAFFGLSQAGNDDCANAVELCPNQPVGGTTNAATIEQCILTNFNGCADDNQTCTDPAASVWYQFTTNASGGSVMVNFTNINFDPNPLFGNQMQAMMVLSAEPCEGANYTVVSICQNNILNGVTSFTLNSASQLLANTTYYVQVNGALNGAAQPAAVNFDIEVTGPGVTLTPLSINNFMATNTTICQGDEENVSFEINGDCPGTPELEWFYNGASVHVGSDFSTSVLSEPGELYVYINCGPESCPQEDFSDSIFFDVTSIVADAGPDLLVDLGQSINIQGSGIGNPIWTPSTGLSSTTVFSPLASAEATTTYFLTVTNGVCEQTDEMILEIKRAITIPSGFTPNDDTKNDVWEIGFIDQYLNNQVVIYDRAGQQVFKTVGYNNTTNNWDGLYKGKPVPPSTYFYVIDLRNGEDDSVYRGPVTIIR